MPRDVYHLDGTSFRSPEPVEPPGRWRFRFAVKVLLAAVFVLAPLLVVTSIRRSAVDGTMRIALHDAATAMEALGIIRNSYAGATVQDLETHGFRQSRDIDLTIEDATIATYTLRACAEGGSTESIRFQSLGHIYTGEPIGCH